MDGFNFDFGFIKNRMPIVTLSSIGLAFNVGARSILGNPEKVLIGFDEQSNAIGVKMVEEQNPEIQTYEFENRAKDGWVRISMRDFMKYLSQRTGIDFLTRAVQFIPEFNDETNTLIIIVDNEHRKDKSKG